MPSRKQDKKYINSQGGYTLIELIVSIGLFMIIVSMATSAFLGVISSNKKALASHITIDNLNFAVESMTRDMKTGFSYHCGIGGALSAPQDCHDGDSYIAFEKQDGDPLSDTDQIIYRRGGAAFPNCSSSEQICRSSDGGATFFAITAPPPELRITGLAFRVYGASSASDMKQPRVVILIIGSSGVGNASAAFTVQTSVSQRVPDLP